MVVDPLDGHKRLSQSSLQSRGWLLRRVCSWMISEGLTAFRQFDPLAVGRFTAWLRARPGKAAGSTLKPSTVGSYLVIISSMYRQRTKLGDSPSVDPFPGETASDAAGLTCASKGSIPFIPDAIAIDLLSKALLWVETYSTNIMTASELRTRTLDKTRIEGRPPTTASRVVERAMRRAGITGPGGRPLIEGQSIRAAASRLADACFVLIAGFVGMRVSEILSMQVGAVEHHPIGATDARQAYVVAHLFKTSDEPGGRVERWLAPAPVVRAVECLERLYAPLRAISGRRELFLADCARLGTIAPQTTFGISQRINAFAAHVAVPRHDGRCWHFSPHQFRKTFARFVARGDRSQLLALADHFKHVSVAMTSRGYVGNDFELHELVDGEGRAETALALDHLLSADRLGGRMGERIVARNHAFRGRAGEQVRRDYIDFVLAETDLCIRGCDYGWCVFQAEVAQCGGEIAPSEAGRGPSMCARCSNFVVDHRHVPYWQDRRRCSQALLKQASGRPLVRAVLAETIGECDRVLKHIEEGDDGGRTEPDASRQRKSQPENTAQAYRAALSRLTEGKATHPTHAGRPVRITPAAVAREARRSRNPLYTTHRAILDEIAAAAGQPSTAADLAATLARVRAENLELRASVRRLAHEKRQLASENLLLLHRARCAEERHRLPSLAVVDDAADHGPTQVLELACVARASRTRRFAS